ncbi:MAG: AEC family transporter [Deltaproteobacteria bacterium]|jgi:predicted permease|nr:AEC family transporter [Deltaproteobacteria bacterium]
MWAVIVQTSQSVLGLYLVGLLGFFLARSGYLGFEARQIFPKLVTQVALPPYLFVSVVNSFNRDQLEHLIYGSIIPILSILTIFFLGVLYTKLRNAKKSRRGIISVGAATSNTIFIGLPVNLALFGPDALPYVLLYFFANSSFFWTIGNYSLSLDGERPPEKFRGLLALKAILSPPLLGFLIGICCIVLAYHPPKVFMDSCSMVGSLTTPLALLFIGITLASCKLEALKPDLDLIMVLTGRFILSPLCVLLLARLLFPQLPSLMIKVFIIQSSLPSATNLALMSGYHSSDTSFASVVVSFSTILSLVTIPIFMFIFSIVDI